MPNSYLSFKGMVLIFQKGVWKPFSLNECLGTAVGKYA
jgi:hypothetical protein